MANLVEYTTDGGLAIIEFNNPPAHVLDYEMMRELDDAILRARLDESVHVLVLRGKGDRFFCGGANIKMMNEKPPHYFYYFILHANETVRRLEMTPKLVIAAINGHCMGGGLEIALACDIRIARRDAGRLGLPEVNLGLEPGFGGTQRLPRLIGYPRAVELLATGRLLAFEEAQEMGLLHHVYEPESFWEETVAYARQFCPPGRASMAVGRMKLAARASLEMGINEGIIVEHETMQQLYVSKDAREGLSAFVERRQAKFTGS